MTIINKPQDLTGNDVWIFTKQAISFDTAFRAVKLLNEMPNRDTENVELYFSENHNRYKIGTARHRVLVISQLFGLLTKTPLYGSGGRYNNESTTEVFELLDKCEFGGKEYNTIKTEQILKVKIRAIIDTVKNNYDWNILPVIFSYKVLHILKEQYNIKSVSLDLFYTYVMTCTDFSEVNEAVNYIKTNSPITQHFDAFKDRSRFLTLVQDNLNLFIVRNNEIYINQTFDNYFNDNFIEKFDIDELNIQLSREVDYTYFLTTFQDFDVNLIDCDVPHTPNLLIPPLQSKKRKKKLVETSDGILEDDDFDYVEKVDTVKEYNINEDVAIDAYKNKPVEHKAGKVKRYSKNPMIGKIAIKQGNYLCAYRNEHETFISSKTQEQYMEAHHLIPISLQDEIWNRYNANIDCVQNIESLCPNCHRAIHYGATQVKEELLTDLFKKNSAELSKIGINITLDELFDIYSVK